MLGRNFLDFLSTRDDSVEIVVDSAPPPQKLWTDAEVDADAGYVTICRDTTLPADTVAARSRLKER
jgi:hypothetical protein